MCGVWRGYDVIGMGGGEFTLRLVLHQKVAPFYWRSDTHTHTHSRDRAWRCWLPLTICWKCGKTGSSLVADRLVAPLRHCWPKLLIGDWQYRQLLFFVLAPAAPLLCKCDSRLHNITINRCWEYHTRSRRRWDYHALSAHWEHHTLSAARWEYYSLNAARWEYDTLSAAQPANTQARCGDNESCLKIANKYYSKNNNIL